MQTIADILLVAGALGAGFYCYILARRLARLNDLESGVGAAVAVLSAQVDDLTKALAAAQTTADTSTHSLDGLTDRAESAAKRLELLVASMHDLPAHPPAAELRKPVQNGQYGQNVQDAQDAPVFRRHRDDLDAAS